MKKLKIMDWYCHQGHQYEFFKTGHDFYLTGLNGKAPNWNTDHRPLPPNVNLISERRAHVLDIDVVIVRSPLNINRYKPFIVKGAKPVAVGQTTSPYPVPLQTRHMVWNSREVMEKYSSHYNKRIRHHYIVHGFDPDEFKPLDIKKNGRVLSICNFFQKRDHHLNYKGWKEVNRHLEGICDVLGHGNEGMNGSIGQADTFEELVRAHSEYSVFLNTTTDSAMPRARAEAAMSGMAIVSTNNFDVNDYFQHNKNIVFADSPKKMVKEIRKLLSSEEEAARLGRNARIAAIKYFHINDYISKWNKVLRGL